MQVSSFLGTRIKTQLIAAARPASGSGCRQVTTCMAKKKGEATLFRYTCQSLCLSDLDSHKRCFMCRSPLYCDA